MKFKYLNLLMITAAEPSPVMRARFQAISRGISERELALGQVFLGLHCFVLQRHAINAPYSILLSLTPINLNLTAQVEQALYAKLK
jgi:hypothetical protein